MIAKDGEYIGFKIEDESDILRLKNYIRNYKPISENDISCLLKTLEKKGRSHLIPFFKKQILGQGTSHPQKESTLQPKKKKKKTTERGVYQTRTCKASDFQFCEKVIKFGEYVLETERTFVIQHSILKKIEGEFTIKTCSDKTFYFEDHGLTQLLGLVEEYCYSILDIKCKKWFDEKINSIKLYVERKFTLKYSDFSINEETGRYEIKDDAIKYSLLDEGDLLCCFSIYLDKLSYIPSRYRDNYESKGTLTKLINQFNNEFRISLTNILRKEVYYTPKDVEAIEWNYKSYKPTITVYFKLVDYDKCQCITLPSFSYSRNISLRFFNLPKGEPYKFSNEVINSIESSIKRIKDNDYYHLLNINIQSIKERRKISDIQKKYASGYFCIEYIDETRYEYISADCLLDISNAQFLIAHSIIKNDYTQLIQSGHINKIAYFQDPNRMFSKSTSWDYVDCYLLANDEYIVLYALDCAKSSYVFKVKSGCIDKAMFLIWSYFSSRSYNKRERKSIDIEYLFSYFGIEWYDNTCSPILKSEEWSCQFNLPPYFCREN